MMEEQGYRSFLRGKDKTDGKISEKYDSLSNFFAATATNEYNQDISLLLVGRKGSGKSYCSLSIAHMTARRIADIVDGDEDNWPKYFDIEKNLAVIDPIRANEVMGIQDRYAVKIYDDIGIGWGSRNWQDENNKAKNDVFQINRVDRQVQIFSVPNQFLLDKVPRSLVSHYAETYKQFFKKGFVTIKMFEPVTLFRQGKIINPHLVVNRSKFVLYAVYKPPVELTKAYNKIRSETTQRIAKMRMEQIAEGFVNNDKPKIDPRVQRREEIVKSIATEADQYILKGEEPRKVYKELARKRGIAERTVMTWLKDGVFGSVGGTTT